MKTFVTILLAAALIGCDTPRTPTVEEIVRVNMETIVIQGCQYIVYDSGGGATRAFAMTHKGNCDNPIHKYNIKNGK